MTDNESSANRNKDIAELRKAFAQGDLSLYLGAGVSVANGLPPWDRLILAMYFSAIAAQKMGGWRPFPNYLFAIAEWHLNRAHEPLEITARRIRKYYQGPEFLKNLRQTLYAGYTFPDDTRFQPVDRHALRSANSTLDAVARLCENSTFGARGVRSVITYNYDDLLETALGSHPFQSFWKSDEAKPGKLPIYHVHGFVPINESETAGSAHGEIVFTEDQYHLAAHDAYSWANLVQMQSISGSVGLMIGLSLADRNMRRLLDAFMRLPHRQTHFALLQRPKWKQPANKDLDEIHEKAKQYTEKFERSGVKGSGEKGDEYRHQIRAIISEVELLDVDQQTFVLSELGIKPIWYENHEDIPATIDRIVGT